MRMRTHMRERASARAYWLYQTRNAVVMRGRVRSTRFWDEVKAPFSVHMMARAAWRKKRARERTGGFSKVQKSSNF
jgi:hypothetical protein